MNDREGTMTTTLISPAAVEYGTVQQVVVHFDDLDAVGMMHNARYAIVLERAISTYWAEHGYTYEAGAPSNSDMIAAVREFAITYHVPIRGTGPIDVHFWLEKMGASSAVYGFRFLSTDHSVTHADGRRVMVKMDQTGRPTRWTDEGRTIGSALLA